MTVGWENILKAFNEKTCFQFEFLRFKNLYIQLRFSWQTYNTLIKNMSLGYDLTTETFTLDDTHWEEIIKVNW